MIPSNKFDEHALVELRNASDEDVLKNISELLEWLQDRNWPVFDGVVTRLSSIGVEIKEPILQILSGNDSVWKANIVGHLIPKFTQAAQSCYAEDLKRLLNNASSNDIQEGLIGDIEIQLAKE